MYKRQLYAKGMSVSDIEEEMREIYEIELSTSAISIITNKVNQAVSYTHLDVYKRQSLSYKAFYILIVILIALSSFLVCIIAVSYTHLDVYKRQEDN